ncbi:cytochrome c oxidase subunit I [Salinithrix halophila]|uniref:Cytochrome c oxidase subunit 1 n=1 Tax=Salinithrix halophila TaxID=1485204 RepID=A0ABV8JE09_9BACL
MTLDVFRVWNRTLKWLSTVDHKEIGILYLVFAGFNALRAGIDAITIRTQLALPGNTLITGDKYNEFMSMHGIVMIFFVAMPLLIGLMNVIVPLQIGARDVAFPYMNALSLWLFAFGCLLVNISFLLGGAPDAGWTSYTPVALNPFSPGPGIDYYVLGVQISGIGTLATGINFLVTIFNIRAPGMSFLRMPLFTWTSFITSALILFAFPPLTTGLLLLMFDRVFGTNFFYESFGGNPLIWQHLFWIFGHPEVYILILPAFGILSEVISTFSRKRLFGYTSMVFATLLIGFLSFMVWAHHMFTVGLGPVANSIFAVATMTIAVPTGIKVFNWLFTMWGGKLRFSTAMLFAVGFIPTFVLGGVTGVMLSVAPGDYQFHDSYFVVAHFHYVLIGGTILGIFSGLYYWWPKFSGKRLGEKLGRWHFWFFFIGFHFTFFPQHFLGLYGMPRRVFTYSSEPMLNGLNLLSTAGAYLMGMGMLFFLVNMVITILYGERKDEADPWDGRTLEWSVPSPVPEVNFTRLPRIHSLDAFWQKKHGNEKALEEQKQREPIHVPSPTFQPLFLAMGLFLAGLGFIWRSLEFEVGGLLWVIGFLFWRSFDRDQGVLFDPDTLKRLKG